MKKLIYPFLLVMILAFQGCEETQSPIYDGSQTLAYFGSSTSRVEVELNSGSQTIDIPVNVSTLSSSDRTFTVTVDAGSAPTSQYDFPGSVTIPANSYFGSFSLTGFEAGLSTDGVTVTFGLEGDADTSISPRSHTSTIVLICPIPASYFQGQYQITQLSGVAPFASIQPAFGSQVVNVGGTGVSRSFDFLYSPNNFQSDFGMTLNLICEQFQIIGRIQSGSLSCDGGATQIGQGNSSNPSVYTLADDSTFTLFMNDFEGPGLDGGCGASPYEIELLMTKL